MNIASWIVQGLLAIAFVMAGGMKLFTSHAELAEAMPWVNDVPNWLPKFIGLAEILGAIGLIAPAATRIRPELTTYAAYGLIAVMVLAAIFHLTRSEPIIPNIVLTALAGFVAWVRTSKAPIAAK